MAPGCGCWTLYSPAANEFEPTLKSNGIEKWIGACAIRRTGLRAALRLIMAKVLRIEVFMGISFSNIGRSVLCTAWNTVVSAFRQ
jgi:hypothetical protein